ncbi:MAG TPA: hypothetical protein VLE97_08005 [Gaiellaceae bacterium]|nr:hypothetical protein [Gaiellaceae bacterium]
MTAYAVDALGFCESKVGDCYFAGGCRCEVDCKCQDCSGLPVAATRVAGMWMPCINSSGFARWFREAGTIISFEEAIWTPFAIMVRGPCDGECGDGPIGHVMPTVGDGSHTCEAMGRAYGIRYGSVFNRRVARCGKVPGLIYGPKLPPKPPPPPRPVIRLEPDMIIQPFHVKSDGHTRVAIPKKWPDGRYRSARIFVRPDGSGLDCRGGSALVGDQRMNDFWRVWFPPTNRPDIPFNPKVDKVIAVCEWDADDGSVPGVFVQYSNGYGMPTRFK